MLMAFADVNFPQVFWADMGVSHIYYPEGAPRKETSRPGRPPASAPAATASPPRREWQSGSRPQTPQREAPAKAATPRQPPFTPLLPELWPMEWQKKLMTTPRAKIAWTYWKLNDDLTAGTPGGAEAAARKKRGLLLRDMFRDLDMPRGSHTFWPACLPDEEGCLAANPQVFWSGILELNCRGVVILGSQAASRLLPQKGLRPLEELRMAGKLAWILRDPDALLANESWYSLALSFLRNAFRTHIR